jgi:hypothetical protein
MDVRGAVCSRRWLSYIFTALLPISLLPASAQVIDPGEAAQFFAERQEICDRDQGTLWGQSLCGPILFVDRMTRSVVANQASADGVLRKKGDVYVGLLPDGMVIANTAFDWNGQRWTMVLWPLPRDRAARRALMIHESWHRIQDSLGLPARSPVALHLATAFGRIAMRMEWRALAAALVARQEQARAQAIFDALVFRAWRRERGGADLENQLELNEGLAEYTGRKLSGQDGSAIAAALEEAEHGEAFARSFAYASGPAYGYLLDGSGTDWRRELTAQSDLGVMLARASRIALPGDLDSAAKMAGLRYGLAAVEQEEKSVEVAHDKQAQAWSLRLVKGPALHLAFVNMKIEFDPRNIFPLPPYGTVYPTLKVIDSWGTLTVTDGALIDNAWSSVSVEAPAPGGTNNSGWELTLNPGWTLKPGERQGDLTVAKTAATAN